MKLLNGLFFCAYILSALVQYNDPDSLPWVVVYLAAACMCVAQYRRNLPRWLPLILLFTSLVWIATLVPSLYGNVSWSDIFESVSMKTKAVEEAREIGGLAFVALWAAVLSYVTTLGSRADPA